MAATGACRCDTCFSLKFYWLLCGGGIDGCCGNDHIKVNKIQPTVATEYPSLCTQSDPVLI